MASKNLWDRYQNEGIPQSMSIVQWFVTSSRDGTILR